MFIRKTFWGDLGGGEHLQRVSMLKIKKKRLLQQKEKSCKNTPIVNVY
ncbi:MAG: hypothetical protein RML72_06960 [Bacteroidia bacterium]|nr:hypothetical protein [Bacteroidia bacterium]